MDVFRTSTTRCCLLKLEAMTLRGSKVSSFRAALAQIDMRKLR